MKKLNLIMISGTGRSGTNVLKEIFSKHSKVCTLPFEYRFIIDPGGIIDFYNSFSSTWSPFIADKKIKDLEKYLLNLSEKKFLGNILSKILITYDKSGKKIAPKSYHGWELNKWLPNFKIHVNTLIKELKTFEFGGYWPGVESYKIKNKVYFSECKNKTQLAEIISRFIRNYIIDLLEKNKKEYFFEDNTWNILFAKELFEIIPEAKLIHVIRDPRDVIASFKYQRWCPDNTKQAIYFYKSIIERWFNIKNEIPSKNLFELKLEKLVDKPEYFLKKICDFTGLFYEEKMLSVNLNKSNSRRWLSEFSEKEKTYLNQQLSDVLSILKYE